MLNPFLRNLPWTYSPPDHRQTCQVFEHLAGLFIAAGATLPAQRR